jgi:hypothetical protein
VVYAYSTVAGSFNNTHSVDVTAAAPSPVASIDAPLADESVGPTFTVSGWTIDTAAAVGTGIDTVHAYAYPASGAPPIFIGVATYGNWRPDVGAMFGANFSASGFTVTATLSPDAYTLVLYPHSTVSGAFVDPIVRQIRVTVATPNPVLNIDSPVAGGTVGETFVLQGWAIDLGSPTGSGIDTVNVWAYPASGGEPIGLAVSSYGGWRPDVGVLFGTRFCESAFAVPAHLSAGAYTIAIYPHSTVSGLFESPTLLHITVTSAPASVAELVGPWGGSGVTEADAATNV